MYKLRNILYICIVKRLTYILMKVFSLLSRLRNLENFLYTGISNFNHHLVWCTVHSAQSPYGCGVMFICV